MVHHKGRKKTTDAETGTAVGSVSLTAMQEKMAKKKPKEVDMKFYRFQKREAHLSGMSLMLNNTTYFLLHSVITTHDITHIAQHELLGVVSCNVTQFISHDIICQLFAIRIWVTCSFILSFLVLGKHLVLLEVYCFASSVWFESQVQQSFCHLDWTCQMNHMCGRFFSLVCVFRNPKLIIIILQCIYLSFSSRTVCLVQVILDPSFTGLVSMNSLIDSLFLFSRLSAA